jgi:nucleoside 2-deoxyribosyltransferase
MVRRIAAVYLAGPDKWFPDAEAHAQRRRDLCEAAGFVPLSSQDGVLVETEPSEAMAREIYADTVARLRQADAVIANLSPWRGVGCDPGAAFEVGFAAALGKPVFAYLNVADEDEADHRERVEVLYGGDQDEAGEWRDGLGARIEDFGLPENLMLWAEARRFFVIVTPDPLGDLTGLELALDAVRLYAG